MKNGALDYERLRCAQRACPFNSATCFQLRNFFFVRFLSLKSALKLPDSCRHQMGRQQCASRLKSENTYIQMSESYGRSAGKQCSPAAPLFGHIEYAMLLQQQIFKSIFMKARVPKGTSCCKPTGNC